MNRYDLIYRLYDEFDTETLREYQEFVDIYPAIDSRIALRYWQSASEELNRRKDDIRESFTAGETLAEIAAQATRDQAFTALDLETKYGRAVNVLVLDVDETLRSAGGTDNEIPRETLHMLTEFHNAGVPIVICTGQTLENVKGFAIQGLGSEIVHSGTLSIVYEAGTGVFTPGHGARTKQLLYEDLDEEIRAIFDRVRSRILPDAPESIRRGCHLQGNEFNVTLKPNYETGSQRAREIVDEALVYVIDLLAEAIASITDDDIDAPLENGETDGSIRDVTRGYYAANDTEIRAVLEREADFSPIDPTTIPEWLLDLLERIDAAYYEADAAEIGSRELNKVVGVERAFDVLDIDEPFALVMGDSKSDLRVMKWVDADGMGIAAAPDHASRDILDHVIRTDELLFDRGRSVDILRTVYAMNRLASIGSN